MIKLVAMGGIEKQWPLYFSSVHELQEYIRRVLNDIFLNKQYASLEDVGKLAVMFAECESSAEIKDFIKLMDKIDEVSGTKRKWKRSVV